MAKNDSFSFTVWGVQPAPQGSKKYVGMRRTKAGNNIPLIVEASAGLPAFRSAIEKAVRDGKGVDDGVWFSGAVRVDAVFYCRKPKSIKTQHMTSFTDVDKLCRSLLDAITKGEIWLDDRQVIELNAVKLWATGEPGVAVTITAI